MPSSAEGSARMEGVRRNHALAAATGGDYGGAAPHLTRNDVVTEVERLSHLLTRLLQLARRCVLSSDGLTTHCIGNCAHNSARRVIHTRFRAAASASMGEE